MSTVKGISRMKVLLVHPSCLLYSEIYLWLEPLGLERVAQAVCTAGHDVRLLALQVSRPTAYVHAISTLCVHCVHTWLSLGLHLLEHADSQLE
jgi:hypothetical protein